MQLSLARYSIAVPLNVRHSFLNEELSDSISWRVVLGEVKVFISQIIDIKSVPTENRRLQIKTGKHRMEQKKETYLRKI
jgi:hypothetical protein